MFAVWLRTRRAEVERKGGDSYFALYGKPSRFKGPGPVNATKCCKISLSRFSIYTCHARSSGKALPYVTPNANRIGQFINEGSLI